jgi:NADPH:quinone reductase-like Zn-dependent oxidoreductase
MKAVIWTKYGSADGLELREMAIPVPRNNELLIRVRAATAATSDTEFRRLKLPLLFAIPIRLYLGFIRPTRIRILGTEFAGEIEAVGKNVTSYRPGDQLFGYTGLNMGTYAEYMCLPEKPSAPACVFAEKPRNVTYDEAAAAPLGGLEALNALKKSNLQPGQKILIVGAGGSIGTYSVQLAKHFGAEVTGVDKPGKLAMLRAIGADHVIDYTQEDFTRSGPRYDVILDTIGKSSFSGCLRVLKEHGTYLNANIGLFDRIRMRWGPRRYSQRILPWTGDYTVSNLLAVKELMEAGTIKAVIDRRYSLDQIAEAHRYVETGHKRGNVVITLEHPSKT